jgi:uncharacterized damage-inducible protein DinB
MASFRLFSKYNTAANLAVAAALRADGAFATRSFDALYFTTPLATVNHIAGVTELWLARLAGDRDAARKFHHLYAKRPTAVSDGDAWLALSTDVSASLAWLEAVSVEAERRVAAATADDPTLSRPLQYETTDGKEKHAVASACWLHLFNHGTHHRGQLHAALCQAGVRGLVLDIPALVDVNHAY